MTSWIRFDHRGKTGFGALTPSGIAVHDGEMFGTNRPSGQILPSSDVELLAPSAPTKIVALWNNFHALAAKLQQPEPAEPLYLLKATTSVTPGAVIAPRPYDSKTTLGANRHRHRKDLQRVFRGRSRLFHLWLYLRQRRYRERHSRPRRDFCAVGAGQGV
jgi:hypothetical protein